MKQFVSYWMAGLVAAFACYAGAQELKFEMKVVDAQPPASPWTKLVTDLDGDGKPDIIVGGSKGPLLWYANPSWEPRTIIADGYYTVGGSVLDMNGDGYPDIIMGSVVWYENPGPARIKEVDAWKAHRVDDERIHDALAGDLDGDGKPDIVGRDQSAFGTSGNKIFIWKQDGPDAWRKRVLECPHGEGIVLADMDGDGDLDIVIPGYWYENTGDNLEGAWPRHAYGEAWTHGHGKVAVGDINGDGRPDVVITPAELKDQFYRISWFEAPVDPKSVPWKEHVIEAETEAVLHSLGLGDMDGDGALDVVTAEMHQGADPDEVRVYRNHDKGQRWTKQVIATVGSHDIQLADVNGNGRLDIVGANHGGPQSAVHLWVNQP